MVLAYRLPSGGFPATERELALVARARTGDDTAFGELMDEYGDTVRRLVRRFVSNAEDASDVEQETWIRAASSLEGLRDGGRFRPWLKSIARNASLSFLSRRQRQEARVTTFDACGTDDFEDEHAETPEAYTLSRDKQRQVWEALGALSERDRKALFLREYRALDYGAISEELGISRNAAEVCVFRARERFRRLFATVEERRSACGVDPLRLSTLIDGEAPVAGGQSLREHVAACADCEARVTAMQAGRALYRHLGVFALPSATGSGLVGLISGLAARLLELLGLGGGSATGGAAATAAAGTTATVTTAATTGGGVAASTVASTAAGGSFAGGAAAASAVAATTTGAVTTGTVVTGATVTGAAVSGAATTGVVSGLAASAVAVVASAGIAGGALLGGVAPSMPATPTPSPEVPVATATVGTSAAAVVPLADAAAPAPPVVPSASDGQRAAPIAPSSSQRGSGPMAAPATQDAPSADATAGSSSPADTLVSPVVPPAEPAQVARVVAPSVSADPVPPPQDVVREIAGQAPGMPGAGLSSRPPKVEIGFALLASTKESGNDEARESEKAEQAAERETRAAAREAEKEAQAAERAVRQAERGAEQATRQAERGTEQAARQAERGAEQAARQAERGTEQAARQAEREAEQAARQAEHEAERATREADRESRRGRA